MNRKIVVSVLIVALLGVSGLCAITGYGLYRWGQRNHIGTDLWRNETFSAQVSESKSFPSGSPGSLVITSDAGDITVTAANVSGIEVEMTKEAWGVSQEEADANAAALQVDVRQTGDRLVLTFRQPDRVVVAGNIRERSIHFKVRIPAETHVELTTSNGAISLDGLHAGAEVHSSFGEISIRNHSGGLLADGGNSELILENIHAGDADIQVSSSFGGIRATGLEGRRIQADSDNGKISMEQIDASGAIELSISFGMLQINGFQADSLTVSSQNGPVEILSGKVTGTLKATGSFGDLNVSGVSAARYDLGTNNGKLDLDGAQGELDINNEFGDITIQNAEQVSLLVHTSNGKVEFSGSLADHGEHTFENSFGDIILHLPAESAFKFNLTTEFGKITSELPLTLTGEMSENQWQGEVNGGGATVRVTTNNGNIKLLEQPARQQP